MVEDQKFGLVPIWAEQVFAQARSAPDNLPELHLAFHRFGEVEVDDFGDFNAGFEDVHVDGDARVEFSFEVIDENFTARLPYAARRSAATDALVGLMMALVLLLCETRPIASFPSIGNRSLISNNHQCWISAPYRASGLVLWPIHVS